MSDLGSKIQASIERLKAFEPADGYLLAFSGGKDSVVLKALADLANVKYEAQYNVTGIDPPELVRFIKKYHPDVNWSIPRYPDGKRVTMWNLIRKKQYPPTRIQRYCCEYLKEVAGKGRKVLTGVRWAESGNRAKNHGAVTLPDARPKEAPDGFEKTPRGGIILNNDNDEARRMLETCYAKQKVMVNPIVDWTDEDVWEFIHSRNIPYCELYDQGWKRLGCIGCPMAGKFRKRELDAYPRYKALWIKAFDDMQQIRKASGKKMLLEDKLDNPTGKDVFDWWTEEKELPGQCSLWEEMEVSG